MTSSNGRDDRLSKLKTVPAIAALDHRHFRDEQGRDTRLQALSRNQRRLLKAGAKRLTVAYNKVLGDLEASGAGYVPDQFLRQMAREFTHRYAESGLHSQPVSFNYFEPFCEIDFLPESVAPYAVPTPEVDHLFSVADYFDHITAQDTAPFDLASLMELPEGTTFHYTPNGSLFDFTYSNADGRDFVVGGVSFVRRRTSLHWSLIGGEVYPNADWEALTAELREARAGEVNPSKVAFIAELRARSGAEVGDPLTLDGVERARKTIIAGETDIVTRKHLGRYLATEAENAFQLICDDPDLMVGANLTREETQRRREIIRGQIEAAAVMWDLVEAMFRLPAYFNYKIEVVRKIAVPEGKRAPGTAPKGAAGVGVNFRYVSALEFVDTGSEVIRTYVAPHYAVETLGHWRRLDPGASGSDAAGQSVTGRTWVKAEHNWRARSDAPRPIYIKSSVAAAKLQREAFMARATAAATADAAAGPGAADEPAGVVYVLRCLAMQDDVYKVGWTEGTATERASQLSAATGVPSAFVVIDRWQHPRPKALEGAVHAMLAPYRLSYGREFFQLPLPVIRQAVEAEIRRTARRP